MLVHRLRRWPNIETALVKFPLCVFWVYRCGKILGCKGLPGMPAWSPPWRIPVWRCHGDCFPAASLHYIVNFRAVMSASVPACLARLTYLPPVVMVTVLGWTWRGQITFLLGGGGAHKDGPGGARLGSWFHHHVNTHHMADKLKCYFRRYLFVNPCHVKPVFLCFY